ncbi:hypothetical protein SOVF_168190 [Spinacia oleracea]|nr:hypothetical protein SOVF_168190 [Spinacia oleracea]
MMKNRLSSYGGSTSVYNMVHLLVLVLLLINLLAYQANAASPIYRKLRVFTFSPGKYGYYSKYPPGRRPYLKRSCTPTNCSRHPHPPGTN